MPSSLSVKLGVIDKDYSEALERNARKFKLFGRELNQGTLELGRSLGATSGSLAKLGSGFQIAGTAAGLFAGTDGLLGIAGSLASGGLLLGGMAAMSYALNQFEKDAEEAKSAVEQFNKELAKIPQNARGLSVLESVRHSLKGGLDAARAAQDAQRSKAGGAEGAAGLGTEIARQGGFMEFIKGLFGASSLDRTIKQLSQELETASAAADDLGNALNTPEAKAQQFAERIDRAAASMLFLGKSGENIPQLFAEIESLSRQIDENLRAAGDPMSKNAVLARAQATALEDAYRAVARIQNAQADTRAFRFEQRGYPGSIIGGVPFGAALAGMTLNNLSYASQLHGNGINPLSLKDLDPHVFDAFHDLVEGTDQVKLAIDAGFDELPNALAGVLAPIILGAFGDNRGAQVGSALGGAFGTGVGAFLGRTAGAGAGTLIGAAFLPIVGGLLGGAIGSLFGGHRKAVTNSADALNRLADTARKVNDAITNLPTGIKVASYRYDAATPSKGNQGPTGDGGVGPRAPAGSGGGGGTGGRGFKPAGSYNGDVYIAEAHFHGVQDVATLARKLGAFIQSGNSRGGATALRVAFTPGT